MAGWQDALQNGALLIGGSFALQQLTIAGVTIWSCCTKSAAKRKHALELLRLLKIRRQQPPPVDPPPGATQPTQPQLPV